MAEDTFRERLNPAQRAVPLIHSIDPGFVHASVRVTQKHYSAWVKARQERAEADVRASWESDPILLLGTKGTPQVHGKREAVN